MIKDKAIIKGKVSWSVKTLSLKGIKKLNDLRIKYLKLVSEFAAAIRNLDGTINGSALKGFLDDEDKSNYIKERDNIYKLHSEIKRYPQTWFQKFFNLPGSLMQGVNHNVVTNEGDALIADAMSESPARRQVDNTNGYIEVGTGYSSEVKTVLACVTPTGSPEGMDATYPKVKGLFLDADDNVTQYKSTFEAGDLNDTGIDEACLMNEAIASNADALAYAELSPAVNMTTDDTLAIDWELTFLGA